MCYLFMCFFGRLDFMSFFGRLDRLGQSGEAVGRVAERRRQSKGLGVEIFQENPGQAETAACTDRLPTNGRR